MPAGSTGTDWQTGYIGSVMRVLYGRLDHRTKFRRALSDWWSIRLYLSFLSVQMQFNVQIGKINTGGHIYIVDEHCTEGLLLIHNISIKLAWFNFWHCICSPPSNTYHSHLQTVGEKNMVSLLLYLYFIA